MELRISSIQNKVESFYIDGSKCIGTFPILTVINFSISNKGKSANLEMTVGQDEVKYYNSVPDYETTCWDFLRDLLKELGE